MVSNISLINDYLFTITEFRRPFEPIFESQPPLEIITILSL